MRKLFFLFGFLFFASSCYSPKEINRQIKKDVYLLASDSLERRRTGTEAEKKAAEYIAKRFTELKLIPKGTNRYFQNFTFKLSTNPHKGAEFSNIKKEGYLEGTNVLGFIDNQAEQTIVIGAHYDHLGYGGEGSLYRETKLEIHNGADDNASGVSLLLHLAARSKELGKANNYLFIAFSGEEMGLLGSNHFTKNTTLNKNTFNYMINMDMVGRLNKANTLAVYGVGSSPLFKQILSSNNTVFKLVYNESGIGPSDHTSFYLIDIPVLHFFTGQHADYHKPSDDPQHLNYEGMIQISDYIVSVINDLDNNGKMTFRKTINESEETPRFSVSLGVVPDYLFDGKGMRIDGVSEDKLAQRIGLKKGDIVIGLGGDSISNMMEYMKALSKHKKGNRSSVTIDRSGIKETFLITFE